LVIYTMNCGIELTVAIIKLITMDKTVIASTKYDINTFYEQDKTCCFVCLDF